MHPFPQNKFERRIKEAFPQKPPRAFSIETVSMNHDTVNRLQLAAFVNKNWMEIDLQTMSNNHEAVLGFSDAALRYFLPSIMVWTYREPQEAVWAANALFARIEDAPGRFSHKRWWEYLTQPQQRIFKDWLKFAISCKVRSIQADSARVCLSLLEQTCT